jgi:ribosome-associated protein
MEDTLQTSSLATDFAGVACALGEMLASHQGGDVVVLDMRKLNFFTDFFIIATGTSSTHLSGLERHLKDFAGENSLEILSRSQRPKAPGGRAGGQMPSGHLSAGYLSNGHLSAGFSTDGQASCEWHLLDFGNMVVHLMNKDARSFFELESLWGAAPIIYSSKSS